MKTLLLMLALAIPAAAQIEPLMKEGASLTINHERRVFVPVKFEPCNLVWRIEQDSFSRETTINLADLNAARFRVEPLKDYSPIVQLMLYTTDARELIKEQTIYPDGSRTDVNQKSVHVLLVKSRPFADKLSKAFASATAKCTTQNGGGQ